MKSTFTFLLVFFTFSTLFAQECTVKILYSINKSLPPSYTFKTDPQTTGAKYSWSFGDATYSDSPSPTHTYKSTDSYQINVKVTGTDGKICNGLIKDRFEGGTVATPVLLSGKGKVKKATSTDGCGLLITMENGTTLVPVEMASTFVFKDGQYLELIYELLSNKPSGCTAGVSAKIDKITEIVQPAACIIPITFTKNTTTPVSYTFKTDSQPDGSKYYWSFGDNGTSDQASPTYAYKTSNTYSISLRVVDKAGKVCNGATKATFEGAPAPTLTGKGKVKKLTSTGCDLVITLDNGTTLIPAKMGTNFQLKDGQYVELTYQKLTEKITTCKEGTDINVLTIKEIVTTPECKAYFTATKDPVTIRKMIFTNLSTGDLAECTWNFGDNTTSKELKPTHEYTTSGTFKVCLSTLTKTGCKSDYCADVKVENPPVVTTCKFDLVIKPKDATLNSYLFYAVSTAEIKTWKWSFGDGKTSDLKNPEHVYDKAGTYDVTCTITTGAGCTETRTIKQTVSAKPLSNCKGAINLLLFDPTDTKCNGKATVKLLDETGKEITNVKYIWSDSRTTSTVENLCQDKAYSVQAIIEGVCQKSYSFTFLSKPIWQASTINGQNSFTVVEPKDGIQYEWDFGNGVVLKGAQVNYDFEKDGVYDVKLTAVSGSDFAEYSQQVVVLKSITGTDIINKSELQIFPNPVKEMLKINFGSPVEKNLLIEIITISGQKIYSQQLNNEGFSQASINVQNLESGIYLLRITDSQHLIAERKFVKAD